MAFLENWVAEGSKENMYLRSISKKGSKSGSYRFKMIKTHAINNQ